MTVARHFGPGLTKDLPCLWESMIGPLKALVDMLGCSKHLFKGCICNRVKRVDLDIP